jgi:Tol biopolymer transport system component
MEVPPRSRVEDVADRLDSWKDIATYLRRDVSTVQRWEKREGLPVHRHLHDKQGSVYAFKSELDSWWQRGHNLAEGADPPGAARTMHPRPQRRVVWFPAAAIGLALVVLGVVGLRRSTSSDAGPSPVRSLVRLPAGAVSALGIALSPDGSHLAYVGLHGTRNSRLYLKAAHELTSRPIPGTDDAGQPFFSPDGAWIGFFSNGQLKKVAVTGGAPITLSSAPNPRGATWGPDNTIVFAPHYLGGLARVAASGGEPVRLTTPNRAALERSHRHPRFLPDGRSVVFVVHRASHDRLDDSEIEVVQLDTGRRTVVIRGGMFPTFSASGHLLYGRGNTIFAVPFDTTRLQTRGTPVPVIEGVLSDPAMGRMAFGVSETGTLVYGPGGSPSSRRLVWVDRSGKTEPVVEETRPFSMARVSPSGRHIVAVTDNGIPRVWLVNVSRRTLTRLSGHWDGEQPFWAPDSTQIGFTGFRFGNDGKAIPALYSMTRGSSTEALPLSEELGEGYDWSPDGSLIAVSSTRPGRFRDIALLSLRGPRTIKSFIAGPGDETGARFARNGRWVAYVSNESGRNEVYVNEIASPRRWRISTEGGTNPVWAYDGRELFYRNDRRVMVAEVTSRADFTATPPKVLFEGPESVLGRLAFDVTPHGRFLMIAEDSQLSQPSDLVLVQNWFTELRGKAPTP